MAEAPRDQNFAPTVLLESSTNPGVVLSAKGDQVTGRLLVDSASGSGTVTEVSVVSANGFAGTVADATTTPAITLTTTITGILKGNGTAISAATAGTDYVTASSINTFTNKTYDTAGSGNSFSINGTVITAVTGTGSVVLATNPTLSGVTFADATDVVLNTNTGTKIGTATTQKLAFYNSTPIVQPTGSVITALQNLGLVASATIPASSITSGAALTKVDDTNVTLTLGGAPTTALLTASSLTLGWTGTLAVTRGGTGGGVASITLFNNITGLSAAGTTGTTSTNLVFSTSPTLTTPVLGVATATSINKVIITAPASAATLTLADGSSLVTSGANSITLTSSGATNVTLPTTGTLATLAGSETLSSKTLTAPKLADGGFIADANGNELIIFTTTASAVNELTLANGATGVNPNFTASGESNVGIDFTPKGTGFVQIRGNSTQAATLALYEDTDDGSNYSAFRGSARSGNIIYTMPTADPSAGQVLSAGAPSGGVSALSWTTASAGGSFDKYMYVTDFSNSARFQTRTSGATNTFGIYGVKTGSSASGYAYLQAELTDSNSFKIYKGNPKLSASMAFNYSTVANNEVTIAFFGIASFTTGQSSESFTDNHIGFMVTSTAGGTLSLYATNANGTTQTKSASLDTPVNGDVYDFRIELTDDTSIAYYWRKNGGSWSSATTHSTNIPSSATSARILTVGHITTSTGLTACSSTWASMSYVR